MIICDFCVYIFLGFYERPDDHKNTLYIAKMTKWEDHSMFAFG